MNRRTFLGGVAAIPAIPASAQIKRQSGTHLRIGLNAYSFNRPLTAGTMTLDDDDATNRPQRFYRAHLLP